MKLVTRFVVMLIGIGASFAEADDFVETRHENWHQWRGPNANGVAPNADPPVRWDASTNVKWKVEIPGSSASTPIVWGDRIFLLTAIETDRKPEDPPVRQPARGRRIPALTTPSPTTLYQFGILCLNRESGALLWKKVATEQVPHEGHHPSHGYASSSPTTNGEFVYASFGSRGLFCFDLDGNLHWDTDFGDMETKLGFGEGTSPVLHGDALIVNWDHEGQSFIARLDARTGEEIWRVPRDEGSTWATPFVVEHNGAIQVVTNGTKRTRSYDLATGNVIWQCGGQKGNPIPTPLAYQDTVFCMTGFQGFALYAIPLNARGDITDSDQFVWRQNDSAPYVASAVLYNDLLYYTKERRGILSCVDAATGKVLYKDQRLPETGMLYASLAAASGRIYVTNRNGTTFVIKHGEKYNVISTNKLGEGIDASPVFVGKQILFRGQKHLYRIETGP
jgi:outer membrane protein assembly factor BamB